MQSLIRTPLVFLVILASTLTFPVDAMPMCRVVSGVKGAPAISINGQPISPLMFCANNQFNRDDVLIEQIKLAADAGIPIISFNVSLAWDGATNNTEIINKFCDAHPAAFFYVRVWLGGTAAWLEAHPESKMQTADGKVLQWVSPASEAWQQDASRLLAECVEEIARGPYGDRFIGLILSSQLAGEWFYPETNEFLDYSSANQSSFRAWLKKQYLNDKAIRRAWGREDVSLKSATIPSPELREAAQWGPFRDPIAQRAAIDYQEYLSTLIENNIAEFARVAKKAMNGRGLVGSFYGYTMELNGVGPRALAQSGHLAFAKLLDVPEIDLIHAPYSYLNRELGNPGHQHLPLDSVPLHGKLAIIEEDSRTHLAARVAEEHLATGNNPIAANVDEMLSINRRNIGNFLTHRAGMWYFDVLSDGRWNDREFWKTAGLTRRMFAEARSPETFRPQIAFLVDEASVHAMRATTYPYLMESLSFWRSELDRVGAPVGYYLQSDLPRLPDSIHVIVLANPYSIRELEQRVLDRFLGKGGTVVWTFAPGVAEANSIDMQRISATTGLTVELTDVQGVVNLESAVTDETWQLPETWETRFRVTTTENVHAIAHYAESDAVAVAATPHKGGISVYSAVPRLPVGVLRWIGANSGVHFYRDTPGMVGIFGPYLVAHTTEARVHTFRLPLKARTVERLVPFLPTPVAVESDTWRDDLPEKTTAIYRITP